MRLFLCFLLLLAPTPVMARDAAEKTFHAEHFTLPNGMEVVVIPNHRAPVVTHMIWYKVGAADEQPGLSGMAHYLEHLLFKGTAKLAPGEYSKRVRVLGGNDNAFTGQDFTAYYASVSVDHLPEIMQMEADRMMNANPPPAHYTSEKEVVLEERRQRTDNDPRAQFGEQLNSLLFINHPYGTPIIGWMEEIRRYEWPDVKKFYDAWYAPNNAILIVSGDMTAERLRPAVEKIYGKLKPKELPPRARAQVPPAPASPLLSFRDESIRQPVWQSVYLAPSHRQNKKDSLALQVLNEILSGGPTTRLYDSLVVKQKKAVSVGFSYNGTALDNGTMILSATPADGVSLEELQSLTEAEIKSVIDNGVTQTEVSEAIERLRSEAIYARDSLTGPAMIIGYALTTGSTLDDLEYWPRDIATVTPEDIQHVAATYLNKNKPWVRPPVTGYMLPIAEEKNE